MQESADPVFVSLILILFTFFLVGFFFRQKGARRLSQTSTLKLLRRVPFLEELSEEQLMQLSHLVKELRVLEDSYVIREFRAADAMYILVSGQVQVLKKGAVDETLLQTKGAGEVIGEMALLTGSRRIASIKSVTPCVLLQIDREDFQQFISARPEISKAVWEACEIHSINLLAADFEKTRSLSSDARKIWVSGRQGRFIEQGETIKVGESGFIALVAGSIINDDSRVFPPALIPVLGHEKFKVIEKGRIAFLKNTDSLQHSKIIMKRSA